MYVRSATFVKGIRGTDVVLYDGIPQVAFIGRSNVGKSSVINALVNRTDLVKSSNTPGKTTELNFFLINKKVYFVDLPGYGFAKLSPEEKEKIGKMMNWYFTASQVKPACVVLIVDAKVGLTSTDKEMLALIRTHQHNYLIVVNKIDKLNKVELAKQLDSIKNESHESGVVPFSAKMKMGVDGLLQKLSVI